MKKHLLTIASVVIAAGVVTFSSCKKEDTTAPSLTITGGNTQSQSLPATAGQGTWTNPTATATDDEDGDVSSSITVSGTVDPNTSGTYTLTYSVSDAAGNTASQTVTVTIANDAAYLGGSYLNASDVCNSGTYTFDATVTTSTTVNGAFVINNFGGFGTTINVNASASGTTITIPSNQTLGGSAFIQSASGSVTNTSTPVFTVNYSWTDGTNSDLCNTTYTHQ